MAVDLNPISVTIPPFADAGGRDISGPGSPPAGPAASSGDPNTRVGSQIVPGTAQELTTAERLLLAELRQADTRIRQHEMAHVAAGSGVVTSGARYAYQRGPDGRNYAVAGEVSIDAAPVPGDPQSTIRKMEQVRRAALAPADPSPQDLKVASQAAAMAVKAQSELMILQAKEQADADETKAFGTIKQASDAYASVNGLSEKDRFTFDLAV
jgi:hypothetical protein